MISVRLPFVFVLWLLITSLYRRMVALSLPVVFLVYSVTGFVTSIIPCEVPRLQILICPKTLEDYTLWTVVGIVGVLAGIVTISMLGLRR